MTASKAPTNLYILRLSFIHFATGILLLLTAMLAAIWLIPDIAQLGTFRVTEGWLLAHLLLLGFASMTAIGASYQLVQVIMRTALFSRPLGYVQYVCYTVGLLLILLGFGWRIQFVAPGGTLVIIGIILYCVNMGMTLLRKREWNPFVLGIALSAAAFLAAGVMGTLLGLYLAGNLPSALSALEYDVLFGSHLWLGIGGWLSGLIVVFSFKLLPMFYVSPKKVTRQVYAIIGGFHTGIGLQVVSLWLRQDTLTLAAYLIIGGSAVWFTIYLFRVRALSRAKSPVGAVRTAFWLIPLHTALFLLWGAMIQLHIAEDLLHESVLAFITLGWFIPSILAYLSKILPFLWWAHRFRTGAQKKAAVLLSEMLPERRLTLELTGYIIGAALLSIGFYYGSAAIVVLGQVLMTGFLLVYLCELTRTFRY